MGIFCFNFFVENLKLFFPLIKKIYSSFLWKTANFCISSPWCQNETSRDFSEMELWKHKVPIQPLRHVQLSFFQNSTHIWRYGTDSRKIVQKNEENETSKVFFDWAFFFMPKWDTTFFTCSSLVSWNSALETVLSSALQISSQDKLVFHGNESFSYIENDRWKWIALCCLNETSKTLLQSSCSYSQTKNVLLKRTMQ